MNINTKRPTRMTVAALVASAALLATGLGAVTILRKAPPTRPAVQVAHATTPSAPTVGPLRNSEADPSFPTAEQATQYYGALAAGDRRSLDLLDAALKRARAEGGNSDHAARLGELRAEYQRRIERHEAKLRL